MSKKDDLVVALLVRWFAKTLLLKREKTRDTSHVLKRNLLPFANCRGTDLKTSHAARVGHRLTSLSAANERGDDLLRGLRRIGGVVQARHERRLASGALDFSSICKFFSIVARSLSLGEAGNSTRTPNVRWRRAPIGSRSREMKFPCLR